MGMKPMTKRPKQSKTPLNQGTDPIEKQVAERGHRMLSGFCIAAGIGSLLFLVFFFSSDIRGKIIAAKTTPAYAAPSSPAETTEPEKTEIEDVLNDPDVSKESVMDSMADMSDEDFRAFIEKVKEKQEMENADTADSKKSDGALQALIEAGADKAAVLSYLQELDEKDFQTTLEAITKAEGARTDVSLRKSLEDAYAEAERLYPGQIDGSKRLKLIDELNATEFMYYVAEEGDTLIKLSRAFGVPLGQLVELNGIHDADKIPAGMILLFPSDTVEVDEQ